MFHLDNFFNKKFHSQQAESEPTFIKNFDKAMENAPVYIFQQVKSYFANSFLLLNLTLLLDYRVAINARLLRNFVHFQFSILKIVYEKCVELFWADQNENIELDKKSLLDSIILSRMGEGSLISKLYGLRESFWHTATFLAAGKR